MQDIFEVFYDKRQIRFVIPTALAYVLLLVPFNAFPIDLGFGVLRPADLVPVLFGVMFGPAAAWGSAFGSLIADIAGSLAGGSAGSFGLGSIFGFASKFVFAYAAYRVWRLCMGSDGSIGGIGTPQILCFLAAALVGSVACAIVDGAGSFILGPHEFAGAMLMVVSTTIDRFIPGAILGTAGLWLLYERAERAGLLYSKEEK